MRFIRKHITVAVLGLVILAVALASAACNGSPPATTTTTPATSTTGPTATTTNSAASTTTSPSTASSSSTTGSLPTTSSAESTTSSSVSTSPAERQAAEAYFAAMAPTIDEDYQGMQWAERVMSQWDQTYGSSDLPTNRQAWNALSSIFQQALSKEREIIKGYEAVTPPEAFQTAHAALLQNNRNGSAWMEGVIAAIKANRPIDEVAPMISAGSPGPSNGQVLAAFQEAAGRVGIELPAKLIDAYTDDADSDAMTV
jgi:hypothetical protein